MTARPKLVHSSFLFLEIGDQEVDGGGREHDFTTSSPSPASLPGSSIADSVSSSSIGQKAHVRAAVTNHL